MFSTGHEYQLYQYSRIRSTSPSIFSQKKSIQTVSINHRLPARKSLLGNGSSEQKISSMVRSLRTSVTPVKNKQSQKIISPKQRIISSFFCLQNQSERKEDEGQLNDIEEGKKIIHDLSKTGDIVFIRGNPEITLNISDHLGSVFVPKIVNYCRETFQNLQYYVIGTQNPVNKSFLHLQPKQYEVLMICRINKKIRPESCEKNIRAYGKWRKLKKNYFNYVLLLFDRKKDEFLYWINYLDPQKLIQAIKTQSKNNRKAQELF